jgi:GNAT superfamily N-acetyltransferase
MISVRAATLDDTEAVCALHIAAWQAAYRGLIPDEILDGLDLDAWVARRRETFHTGPRVFVAVDAEDRPIGHTMIDTYRIGQDPDRREPGVGEIWAIYAHPDHWGTGVGRALIRAALAELPQPEVRLWVLEGNLRARAFYERNGLYPDGTWADWVPRGSEVRLPELRYAIVR